MSFLVPANEAQLEFIKKQDFYQPAAVLEEDVDQLIEWLSKQPHLPKVTDRKWLTNFIIGCKYNLQKAKQVIEAYFVVRAEHPEFFGNYTKEQLEDLTKIGNVSAFPKMTPEGYRIFCTKTKPIADDEKFDVHLYCGIFLSLLDLQLREEPIHGNIFLYDLKYCQLSQFLAFTPTTTKNLLKCGLHSFPLRVRAVHYINPPMFTSRLVTFFKMFMPAKIKERIFVHESLEELHQHIPKECLPEVYGGTGGDIEKFNDGTFEWLLNNSEWLAARQKADLSRMPNHKKSDEMDMNGTFKKLQID